MTGTDPRAMDDRGDDAVLWQSLAQKARQRRCAALNAVRMPVLNIFWDGRPPRQAHTVVAQMSDLRVRMGPRRQLLAPMTV
ncbi:hypothetical protein [Oceaniglobus trochenteri]|uniref:hypothetical protein n=1 Tax=Oceaniglobus trochenteri TaxID=2763260 RepID=UPI001CFFAFC1|nr:hypothetical protein [Oceaniglobus trochenteri]